MDLLDFRVKDGIAWRRAAVCLLLAVLFLYNPFFTILSTSGVLHVQQPYSFRATVAASELRRCVAAEDKLEMPVLEVAALSVLASPQELDKVFANLNDEPAIDPVQAVRGSIWFRPPPVS